jgi:hypothetical protein
MDGGGATEEEGGGRHGEVEVEQTMEPNFCGVGAVPSRLVD